MQLTPNFTLEELIQSNTADANNFDEQYNPPSGIIKNLRKLAENVLQPARDAFSERIMVNCGYRCPRTNQKVGGVALSQHVEGKAADITAGSKEKNEILFKMIIKEDLPFDQLIDEQNYAWIHVSYDETRTRKQILHL
jgi:hypothetical protein